MFMLFTITDDPLLLEFIEDFGYLIISSIVFLFVNRSAKYVKNIENDTFLRYLLFFVFVAVNLGLIGFLILNAVFSTSKLISVLSILIAFIPLSYLLDFLYQLYFKKE